MSLERQLEFGSKALIINLKSTITCLQDQLDKQKKDGDSKNEELIKAKTNVESERDMYI